MNISIAIPQLFYDLIARVFPGFMFLSILRLELTDTGISFDLWKEESDVNFIASLGNGIGYFVMCYFAGVILKAAVLKSSSGKIKERVFKQLNSEHEPLHPTTMFQRIRLENSPAGFRLTKLRAEATMVEVCRWSMLCLSVYMFLLGTFALCSDRCEEISYPSWAMRSALPAIVALAFWRLEAAAWSRYFGNIRTLYPMICIEGRGE